MADTNSTRLGFIREVTAGVIPTTPVFQRLRYTGAPDLGQTPKSVESEEIVDSGELSDLSLVSVDIGGSANIEFSFQSFDDLLEAAMRGTYQAKRAVKVLAQGLNITGPSTLACTATAGIIVGDIVYLNGYANPANQGRFKVSVVTANTNFTLTKVDGSAAGLVTEAATAAVSVHKIGIALAATNIVGGAPTSGTAVLTFIGTTLTTESLEAGDYIQITGWNLQPQNSGFYRIRSVDTNTQLTVDQLPDLYAADIGTGASFVVIYGERLKNATSKFTYTLQELFTDIGTAPNNTRQLLSGMGVNALSLSVKSESLITGQLSFVGTGAVFKTAPEAGETFVEQASTTPLNSSSDVARIFEAGGSLASINAVQEMSVEINNNLAKKSAVGKLGGAGFRRGTFSVSGNLTTYFDDKTKVDKVLNNTETSLALGFKDPSAHGYLIDLPRVKFSEGGPSVKGRNDDVIAQLKYVALRSTFFGYTTKLMRFWSLV